MDKAKDIHSPRLRNDRFSEKIATKIWQELPSADNPYVAKQCLCHGYDLLELMKSCSYAEVLFLLFRGEFPSDDARRLLEALMIGLINPGPRHPATRAAISSAVSKTNVTHLLPISLSILSGSHLGADEVGQCMEFIKRHQHADPPALAEELTVTQPRPGEGDWRVAPGFGTRFNSIDILPQRIADTLLTQPAAGEALQWAKRFADALASHRAGWLIPAVAAAALLDLGFHYRQGAGLFQLLSAPGLLAHGLEMSNKPITSIPFIDNEHYFIEE